MYNKCGSPQEAEGEEEEVGEGADLPPATSPPDSPPLDQTLTKSWNKMGTKVELHVQCTLYVYAHCTCVCVYYEMCHTCIYMHACTFSIAHVVNTLCNMHMMCILCL